MTTHFIAYARYHARPETADEVARLLLDLAAASRAEEGNVDYTIARDLDDPTFFSIVERYRDAAAFQVHRDSAHFAAIGKAQIIPLLEERVVAGYSGDGIIA